MCERRGVWNGGFGLAGLTLGEAGNHEGCPYGAVDGLRWQRVGGIVERTGDMGIDSAGVDWDNRA